MSEFDLTGKVDLLSSCKLDSAGLQRLCEVYDSLPSDIADVARSRTFEAPQAPARSEIEMLEELAAPLIAPKLAHADCCSSMNWTKRCI